MSQDFLLTKNGYKRRSKVESTDERRRERSKVEGYKRGHGRGEEEEEQSRRLQEGKRRRELTLE